MEKIEKIYIVQSTHTHTQTIIKPQSCYTMTACTYTTTYREELKKKTMCMRNCLITIYDLPLQALGAFQMYF